jgi:S-adenosylmethionine synthetase
LPTLTRKARFLHTLKNPVTHVGKLYNVVARRIADDITRELETIVEAECCLVSRIGVPIDRPQSVLVRLGTADGLIDEACREGVGRIVSRRLETIGNLWRDFLNGAIPVC